MKTIAKISEETLTIVNYLEDIPKGADLTYKEIEKATGVKMNTKGKSYLRSAIKKTKRLYSAKKGIGIKLVDEHTATFKLVHDNSKIGKATDRAKKAQKIIMNDFYEKLAPGEQKLVMFYGACYGAIEAATKDAQRYLKNLPYKQFNSPMLPENIK